MLPVHILLLEKSSSSQFLINISSISLLVVSLHPEQEQDTDAQACSCNSQVESVTNVVVGSVERQERPSGDQTTNVAEHNVGADGRTAGCVGYNICADLSVTEGAEGECTRCDDESCAVTNGGVLGSQEHDAAKESVYGLNRTSFRCCCCLLSNNDQRSGRNKNDQPPVSFPTDIREHQTEEATDHVWRNGVKLLADDCVVGVDGANNSRRKESKSLNRNVVEQEDHGSAQSDRRKDALEDLFAIKLVQNLSSSDSLGLDTRDSQILFFLREPSGRRWSVGQGEERDD